MSLFQYCTKRLFSLKQDLQTTLPTMLFDLLAYASTFKLHPLGGGSGCADDVKRKFLTPSSTPSERRRRLRDPDSCGHPAMRSRRKRITKNVAKKVVYRIEEGIKEEEDVGEIAKKILILEDHGEDEGADEEDDAHAQDAAVPSSMAPSGLPPCSQVPDEE